MLGQRGTAAVRGRAHVSDGAGGARSGAADCLRRRVADEGWGAVRLWAARVVGVAAWWTAAALTVWLGLRLWSGEADLVGRGREALESGSQEWSLWVASGVCVIGAVAVAVYAREMASAVPLVWRWRPWRPYAGFSAERGAAPLWVSAPRVSMPWLRRPELVWVPQVPAAGSVEPQPTSEPETADVAPDPDVSGSVDVGEDPAGEEQAARDRASQLQTAEDEPGTSDDNEGAVAHDDPQGVLELPPDEAPGETKRLLRLLTPMPSLHSGGLEMMVLVAMGGGVLVHQDVMSVLGIPRDAVTKRARRLEGKGWLSRNEDLSFRMGDDVITDLEMLERAIAAGAEDQACAIATEIRSRPLPQIQAEWLDRNDVDSMRERLVTQADNALTRACEEFPDSQGVFERAVVAMYGR